MMNIESEYEKARLETIKAKGKLEEATDAVLREHLEVQAEKKAAKNLLRRIVRGVINLITPKN